VRSDTQTRKSAYYASVFDADFDPFDESTPSAGRHRANQAQGVELELEQICTRLGKLRQRMRSALSVGVFFKLAFAALALIVLSVGSLMSFVRGESGIGLLLGALFVLGVPATGVAAVRAGRPWLQLGHEAALLRQREKELYAQRDGGVLPAQPMESSPTELPDEVSALGFGSVAVSGVDNNSSVDNDPPPSTEYSALSASSHVLAQAIRDSLSSTPPDAAPARLVDASPPAQPPTKRLAASTKPSWWSPTGLHERAIIGHSAPAQPEAQGVRGWVALLVMGTLLALFAIGIILGVLTSP